MNRPRELFIPARITDVYTYDPGEMRKVTLTLPETFEVDGRSVRCVIVCGREQRFWLNRLVYGRKSNVAECIHDPTARKTVLASWKQLSMIRTRRKPIPLPVANG